MLARLIGWKCCRRSRIPGSSGETDGMNELSEIEDDGSETDRMNVLSEVQEPGGIGEDEGRDELSEVVKAGGETDWMDALMVIGDAGDNGDADWMEARLERNFDRICKKSGVVEVPKISRSHLARQIRTND